MAAVTPEIALKHCALLLLDMQNEFLDPEGAFARNGLLERMSPGQREELVANTATLVGAVRQAGSPVIYLKTVLRSDYADCFLSPPWRKGLSSKNSCLVEGTKSAEIIEELQPQGRDFVIVKKGHSAFQHTCLDPLLISLDVDTCIVTGNLHGSAHETFGQGGALGYDFILAADACYPLHSPYLETFRNQAVIKNTADLVSQLLNLQMKKPAPAVYKPALLMIDLQNDSVHTEGANHRLGFSKITDEERNEVVRNNQRLAHAMRERGLPVIYIRLIKKVVGKSPYVDTATSKISLRTHPVSGEIDRGAEGTWGAEFLDELRPQHDDFIVMKRSQSAFGTTHLHRLLRNLGVNLILATGGSVTACLASTVREGIGLGYRAIVAADATYPPNKRNKGLAALASRAEINTTQEILTKLAQGQW